MFLIRIACKKLTQSTMPVYGIKFRNLKEFTTTKKDRKRGVSRIPQEGFRIDSMFDQHEIVPEQQPSPPQNSKLLPSFTPQQQQRSVKQTGGSVEVKTQQSTAATSQQTKGSREEAKAKAVQKKESLLSDFRFSEDGGDPIEAFEQELREAATKKRSSKKQHEESKKEEPAAGKWSLAGDQST